MFAAKLKNKAELLKSTSGGAFVALSEDFVNEGNAVACAKYDYESNNVVFTLVTNKAERDKARGTKYIQAQMGDIYAECVTWLKDHPGKKVMFFGLGCQTASFQQFISMKRMADRIVTIDIICHGAPSPRIWKEYIECLTSHDRLQSVNFRDKKTGWNRSVGTAVINGREVSIQDFRRLYSSRNLTRPSCYFCPYTKIDRASDITIGDFWHIEKTMPDFVDQAGVSLIITHTDVGELLFEQAKKYMDYRISNTTDCWQYNLEKPTEMPPTRAQFWKEHRTKGIRFVVQKYGQPSGRTQKIRKGLKLLLAKIGLVDQYNGGL